MPSLFVDWMNATCCFYEEPEIGLKMFLCPPSEPGKRHPTRLVMKASYCPPGKCGLDCKIVLLLPKAKHCLANTFPLAVVLAVEPAGALRSSGIISLVLEESL